MTAQNLLLTVLLSLSALVLMSTALMLSGAFSGLATLALLAAFTTVCALCPPLPAGRGARAGRGMTRAERRRLLQAAAARRRTLVAIGTGLALLLGLLLYLPLPGGGGSDRCAATSELVPPCGAWWGAYVPNGPDGLVASVGALEQQIGRPLDLVYTYHDMGPGTWASCSTRPSSSWAGTTC
ncbi:hypothetical protein GXW82_42000 [Streptacidiphilus sp. 4-A2]|nr:hypothetical protein [Streptacidiphilus sp. 4-A2]